MCLWYMTQSSQCYAISSYLVHDRFDPYENGKGRFDYDVEYLQQAKHVTFKAILKTEKFIYFLFNTEDGYSKLGKMCIDSFDTKTNTFEDTPILCSYGGNNYTLAQDAVHWKEYLFVAFSDDLLNVICKYKFRNIAETFMESRQDRLKCPYVTANTYFREQTLKGWCFNKTSGLCQDGFRNIYVDENRSKQLETFNIVQHSFPVLDIKVQNQNVYVMTENTVINMADDEPCPSDVTCIECMTSENPACGWDIQTASCGACVKTTYCFWCLGSVSCVKQAATCNFTVNISGNDTEKLTCVVGNVQYAVVVDDSYTVVVCQNVNAPRLNNSKLYLEYNGSRLDNAADVEVYECNDFSSSCGVCKYHVNQGYKCDWCGLCKTTIAGAPERCQKGQTCAVSAISFRGPEFGGTIVNITGTNIGNRGDTISVTINGVKCENVTVIKPSTVISCITCNGSASTQDGTEVTVNGVISPLARHKYTFQSELELSTFSPSSSIVSGGRKISIQGTKIGFTGSRYNVLFCNNIKCIHCRFIQIEDDNTLTCNMEGSGSFITLTYLTVTIDENTHLRLNNNFMIVADPLVNPLSVDSSSVFRSGGVKLTITGTGFSNVGVVIIDTPDAVPCTILSDNSVICKSPPYVKSDFERRKRAAIQNIYVNFDDYRVSLGVFYVDDPLFEKLSKVFIYISNAVIEIKGHGLLQGARPDDYLIRIGLDGLCIIIEINNYNITCLPPGTKPRTNTGDLVFIVVVVGNINEHVGYLRYESATSETNNVVLYGVAGGGIIVTFLHARMEFDEPYDEVYDEINSEEESYSKSNRNTYLDVTSGYEDLGQMTATNAYNELQQPGTEDLNQEITNNDYLTSTQLSSNDFTQSNDYMEPVDTTN
ncbi:unnamed protein product [Mytilus edulis]|uniref:IPT/TIG domain-containing protein n=1 Tax=Mytilus edulis TaxID=6550 RepID=A0A8S3V544_MYTED|nr:unnamed protein product [Mytilus edulis]